ncbi:MAG: tyrosine-type recombinase/integrase [Bacteroidaceae bacterium]|nr:tyrosine-type recombinase/integrase [Bacteroidaceae bacterium]
MTRTELRKTGVVLKHYGPHSIRHGCATELINTGISLKEIADLFGHVRLDTTRIYAKTNLASLREVADLEWEDLL